MKIRVIKLECDKCGHAWIPRTGDVKRCPKCNTTLWNTTYKGMSSTEYDAMLWLASKYKLDPNNITFRFKDSPDFILPDGTGYEVKSLINGRIQIFGSQWQRLLDYVPCFILAMPVNGEPIVMPMDELPLGTKNWGGIDIRWAKYHQTGR
jgi:hypothetical protein